MNFRRDFKFPQFSKSSRQIIVHRIRRFLFYQDFVARLYWKRFWRIWLPNKAVRVERNRLDISYTIKKKLLHQPISYSRNNIQKAIVPKPSIYFPKTCFYNVVIGRTRYYEQLRKHILKDLWTSPLIVPKGKSSPKTKSMLATKWSTMWPRGRPKLTMSRHQMKFFGLPILPTPFIKPSSVMP